MGLAYIANHVVAHPLADTVILSGLALALYIIRQRLLHPLAKYPGPFIASFTDLWQVFQFLGLKQPYNLTRLHERYGPVVRYGPDKLSITHEQAIPILYSKGGRMFPKTEFYDAYGAAHPNVFEMRDEKVHGIRRRHMSRSFSTAYVKDLEIFLDSNLLILRRKVTEYAATGKPFDLTKALHHYVIDVLGELAFGQSFGVQEAGEEIADSMVPPVVEHSLLAAATGAWPRMTKILKRYLPMVPFKPLRDMFAGRQACVSLAAECVARRVQALEHLRKDGATVSDQRKDILTSLVLAKDPETGAYLEQADLETKAFGFIIAGTHTTSATTSLLFYHLLHSPEVMARLFSELDANLPELEGDEAALVNEN